MSYKFVPLHSFEKELKQLAKKYPSVKNDLIALTKQLNDNPFLGEPLGKDCYKIRLAIASKGKGKSGGARVITHVRVIKATIYLISIYDKSEQGTISDKELIDIIKQL